MTNNAEYQKQYRLTHKDKKAVLNKRWYEKNKTKIAERQRLYRETHKKEISECKRKYRINNKEKCVNDYKRYLAKHLPYQVWNSMKQRCNNVNNDRYQDYGGRGIIVCEEWLDYKTFESWAYSNGWKQGLTIDRIDNEGNYEPSNCQFITREENTRKDAGKKTRKQVNQFDFEGNLVATYCSTLEAERQTGIDNGSISGNCRGERKQAGNYKWEYSN